MYKVTRVFATNKKRDGTPIVNKWGKTRWRVGLKVESHGDKWINGFTPFDPKDWEGKEVDLHITESFNEQRGETELKFELPKKASPESEEIEKLKVAVRILEQKVSMILQKTGPRTAADMVSGDAEEPEIDPEDIPF